MNNRPVTVIGGVVQDIRIKLSDEHDDGIICFDADTKAVAKGSWRTFGGGAINVSVGLARLGDQTKIIGSVGSDARSLGLHAFLQRANVEAQLAIDQTSPTGLSIVLTTNGKETVISDRAANNKLQFSDVEKHLAGADIVITHLSGSSENVLSQIVANKDREGLLLWNPGQTELEKGVDAYELELKSSPVVILNVSELREWTDKSGIQKGARTIMDMGAEAVVVTRGNKGSVLYQLTPAGIMGAHIPATGGPAVDRVGAGDAYTAAFMHIWRETGQLEQAAWAGSINAGAAITVPGAVNGSLDGANLTEMLRRYPLAEAQSQS